MGGSDRADLRIFAHRRVDDALPSPLGALDRRKAICTKTADTPGFLQLDLVKPFLRPHRSRVEHGLVYTCMPVNSSLSCSPSLLLFLFPALVSRSFPSSRSGEHVFRIFDLCIPFEHMPSYQPAGPDNFRLAARYARFSL